VTDDPLNAPAARLQPSASYSFTMRLEIPQHSGAFARVAQAIAETHAMLGAIDLVRVESSRVIRDVTVACVDASHAEDVVGAVRALEGITVDSVSDRTFLMHKGGKIEVNSKLPLRTRDDLSMAYTPGVGRVSQAIAQDPSAAWTLTIKGNTVAVVSDGTAILGLGDLGPEAAMPVMEGKAMLFKEFAGVDAFPLCIATKDVDEIVAFVKAAAPTFGGINLEDIAAPRCFEIERRLRAELDIPVFHDDQHGTAIVVLAALLNALRVVGKRPEDVTVVVIGAGAAGVACTEIILAQGVGDVIVVDRDGALVAGDPALPPARAELAARTNRHRRTGSADAVLAGADVALGVSGPGAFTPAGIRGMAADAIVFALANPVPEVHPEQVRDEVAIIATGRSDYPNQINNVLAFPGVFKGALEVRARTINEEMKLAAAQAIARVIPADELHPDYIVPSVFNRRVAEAVAEAVANAAVATGVARRTRGSLADEPSMPLA
jgi:malate dehydrogenase (oxaloacetate-decarboxylating)